MEVCAWSVMCGLSHLLLLKLSTTWSIVWDGKKASLPSIWCQLWGEDASAIAVPMSSPMLSEKTFLPRSRNSYLVNVSAPDGDAHRGLRGHAADLSSKLAVS